MHYSFSLFVTLFIQGQQRPELLFDLSRVVMCPSTRLEPRTGYPPDFGGTENRFFGPGSTRRYPRTDFEYPGTRRVSAELKMLKVQGFFLAFFGFFWLFLAFFRIFGAKISIFPFWAQIFKLFWQFLAIFELRLG